MSDKDNIAMSENDRKDLKKLKFFMPFSDFAGGASAAFMGTYLSFFYTNVYHFSVTLSSAITVVTGLVTWIVTPLFAAVVDRTRFRTARYWPWIFWGSLVVNASSILTMALGAFGLSGGGLVMLVFVLALIRVVGESIYYVPVAGCFPILSRTPEDRQYFARAQKIGRDGGKMLFGYIVPALIVFCSGLFGGDDLKGYALTALLLGGFCFMGYALLSLAGLRGSYVEREGMKAVDEQKAEKTGLSDMLKAIFGNRELLGMFFFMLFHKTYYFLYIYYAAYAFEYVFANFTMMGTFMLLYNLFAIVGAFVGGFWGKIFKDSKRSMVAAFVAHIAVLAVIAVWFKSMSSTVFLVLFSISSLFMGMLENWILPLFAAASDYGTWKTGTRNDNLTMSIYTLSIYAAIAIVPIIGGTVLNSIGYTEWLASGAAPTDSIINGISSLITWAPLILAVVCLVFLVVVFDLNDSKIAAIQKELKERGEKA